MVRDFDRYKKSLELHEKWQFDYFNVLKNKLIEKAKQHKEKGNDDKYDFVMKEANSMRFQFNKSEALIQYGNCSKFNSKPISFIPNICQLDTQKCFENRKQI
jgi:hypothetical protein